MAVPARSNSPRKPEYRVRFTCDGETKGASLHSDLGERLGIALQNNERIPIDDYLERLAILDPALPDRLRGRVARLFGEQKEFTYSGDFVVDDKNNHLHISGRILDGHSGDVVYSLLFLDDTEHTELRRLYEYMFRLANHELKGPLACVIGAVDFAEEHVAAGNLDGVKTCLDMIERNASLLEEMIFRYLNLSQIESGSISLTPDRLLFSEEVLNPVVADMQPSLHRKHMRVKFDCGSDDDEPELWADSEKIEIVIRNLISNAVKYGEPDSEIRVAIQADSDDSRVTVTNLGPEIPTPDQAKLFDKFVRLDTSAGTKGAGLGLYNSKSIVAFWGGEMDVHSENGETSFSFTIPNAPDPALGDPR
jgi:signal transduction histidine kinase